MLSTSIRGARPGMRRRRLLVAVVAVIAAPALTSMMPGEPAAAAPVVPRPAPLARVKLGKARTWPKVKPPNKPVRFDASGHTALPGAQDATVAVPSRAKARAGSSPISVAAAGTGAAPATVRVRTADQKTARAVGVHGVLFSVQSTAGTGAVDLSVDPASFRNAYGGGYAGRLHLVRLPGCALTTPQLAKCQQQTPVTASDGSPLAARVSLAAPGSSSTTVMAATSDASGGGGDYTATSLSPGGTWATSGNTGAFTYTYPIGVPPALAGPTPNVDLSYDSASQDARTEGTNSQSSWIGDGWSSADNYIERSYESCTDVSGSGAPTGSGDQCWKGQILTLSLNGRSTPIVYDAGSSTFRLEHDSPATKVENFTGANGTKNGTDNGEYFRVTEGGTKYYFGLNRLPGWASGDEETKSALTLPVYKAHAGASACPDASSFADTACTLGYRFNLDYVVDANGNASAYYYSPETGYYGADNKNTPVSYVRATTLKRVDYGMTASTIYSAIAPEQVVFGTGERCIPGDPAGNTCDDSQFTVSNPAYWPDTPVDLNCTSGGDCTNHAPSFWSRRMLTTITTQIQSDGATKQVDRYDLAHSFPDNGDHAPTLWLQSVTHTGLDRLGGATANVSAGTVTFYPEQLRNRVGTLPGLPRLYYQRLHNVVSETGAETVIEYDTPDCSSVPASDPSDSKDTKAQAFASTNTTWCFPIYWTPEGQPEPLMDWFYVHPVTSVTTYDNINHYQDGSVPRDITQYTYKGNPGWHYDDNELVKAKNRTWG